ncbi:hypothetical protein INS49_012286 [Diaporthe citri]|uniref:uncharacterized protein n=1 Tax=Diaporthe citri TaxID=83186 RepID=UPI001C81ED6C|nr:uncharacterized protein INS49_012286 [Diaporthe citri]KAG6358767.1 hypothetical protein INS49_012286 [Diaporthe citri]
MHIFESIPRPVKTYHSKTYDRIAKDHGFHGEGKTVLITGGSSGVGYSIAQAFAAAGAARVAIVSRSPGPQAGAKAALEAANPAVTILAYQACVTDASRMEEILRDLGTVDVLVLGAAAVHRRARAVEITPEEVRDAFATNVVALFELTKAFLALPPPGPGGGRTIINISSAGAQVSGARRVGYGPSKAAAAQVLQHFASDARQVQGQGQVRGGGGGNEGAKIVSFHPGAFYTPTVAEHFAADEVKWDSLDLPAHFALWLAGSESGFLHGRHVWANWDVDELVALKDRLATDPHFLTIGLVL